MSWEGLNESTGFMVIAVAMVRSMGYSIESPGEW